jgi:predicted MFS family arabinose efflux permease
MHSITASRPARRLLSTSIIARLPLTMLSIALLVHVQHLTGSFALAGVVMAAYAAAIGVGGPLLGVLVDRCGQTAVLFVSVGVSTVLLAALAVLPPRVPVAIPVVLASGLGLATPPLAACLRTLLPSVLSDPASVRAAYAFEASASELTWVAGPPLALGVGAVFGTGAALAVGAVILLLATVAFAVQPASRSWRPVALSKRPRGGALHSPAMRTIVLALLSVGVLFGSAEVAITASARALDGTAAAAPLLTLWGVGSIAGGLLATRLGGGAVGARGLSLVLLALAVGHLALVPVADSIVGLGVVLLIAGAAIAPTFGTIYAMVDLATPEGTATEAFAWLATALAIGEAIGAAAGGAMVDQVGSAAAFGLAGSAGLIAVLTTALRSGTFAGETEPPGQTRRDAGIARREPVAA